MAKLMIWRDGASKIQEFDPPMALYQVLELAGMAIAHPCGGRGVCGKCAVELKGQVSDPNQAEQKIGARLTCQAQLLGDAEVVLPASSTGEQIEISSTEASGEFAPMEGKLGAAVDIGTTTVAMKLVDLETGDVLSAAGMFNPQSRVAADVMGRIGAAMNGQAEQLKTQVVDAINSLLEKTCTQAGRQTRQVDTMVVTGNTTMLYLLTGRDPSCLSCAPFHADELFGFSCLFDGKINMYLPPCMNAFVGADITCAVQSSGMCNHPETSLLCDIGTNGEIALWKDGRLYVTSTAAGPAFEGAGISCGCGSMNGAIDKVWVDHDEIKAHTIGDVPAVGVCGSGLIDAIAAFLDVELVDETGASDEDELMLRDGVALIPKDVRQVQVAKAAIAAGMETLMEKAGIDVEDVTTLYIAGGFGSHLNVRSAARIGLIPEELADRVRIIGNAALEGAVELLRNRYGIAAAEHIAENTEHLNLGGNPVFSEKYMEQMLFPEAEE